MRTNGADFNNRGHVIVYSVIRKATFYPLISPK